MLLLVHLFFLLGSVCISLNVFRQVGKPIIETKSVSTNKLGAAPLPSASKKQTVNKPALVKVAISQNGTANKKEPPPTPPPKEQNREVVEEKVNENNIFDEVEIEASFPGGDSKWRHSILSVMQTGKLLLTTELQKVHIQYWYSLWWTKKEIFPTYDLSLTTDMEWKKKRYV